MDFEYDLGDEVKDKVTDLHGIVVGRIQWFGGRLGYVIQPRIWQDNPTKLPQAITFESERLEIATHGKVAHNLQDADMDLGTTRTTTQVRPHSRSLA